MSAVVEARPASTVVLLRDAPEGLETLLLLRNKALAFAGGLWVFPGGALDREDIEAAGGDEIEAARLAAAREAHEESGLHPALDEMVLLGHWTTPVVEPKRFSTHFFAAPVAVDRDVVIDQGEIHDSRWIGVREAIAAHERGELGMLPPTYVNLLALAPYDDLAAMLAGQRAAQPPQLMPVVARMEEGFCAMFPGDAGYHSGDPNAAGARHRAVMEGGRWHYLYRDVDPAWPRLAPT